MGFQGSGGVGGAAESDEGGDQWSYGMRSNRVPRRAVQVRETVASSCVWRQMKETVAMKSDGSSLSSVDSGLACGLAWVRCQPKGLG
ncbi:hypothetical protein EV2_032571 [Malus domestica]